MARLRHTQEFGSDSFLDVLANMVGILIILVVVAGTRISKVYLPPPPASVKLPPISMAEADALEVEPVAPPAPPPELEPDEAPAEVAAQLQQLQQEIAALEEEANGHEQRAQTMSTTADTAREQAESQKQRLIARLDALRQRRLRIAGLGEKLARDNDKLTGILAEFEVTQKSGGKVEEVAHHLTPISQQVEGHEIHFRLQGNKVAYIPLDELVSRLKSQIDRQKEWLARFRRHEGAVGPVRGFTMQYVVERQSLSPREEIRHGTGAFRLGVAVWRIVPEPDLDAETLEQALQAQSQFASELRSAPEGASLTFWVYPDSFALFRKLQTAAHAAGFVVSARPLPEGTPIAGSPNGSKSAGQ